jgi:hypothetical protein
MLSGPVYITPTELLTRAPLGAIPRSDVPGPFKGKITAVSHLGTSTGQLRLGGSPIDAYDVVVNVVVGGDLGTAEFGVSLDGGVTFDDPILSDPNGQLNTRWDYAVGITGLVLSASNGTSPSFVAGDTWSCTTTASPKLLQVCGALSDFIRKWLENTGQSIADIDEADRTHLCHVGRVWLCSDRGEVPAHWLALYKEARTYFHLESKGDLRANVVPNQDSFVFADYERARGPFRFVDPNTGRRIWRH